MKIIPASPAQTRIIARRLAHKVSLLRRQKAKNIKKLPKKIAPHILE